MAAERYFVRGRIDLFVLRFDEPVPIAKGQRVRVRFIPVPLEQGQSWGDLTPEQLDELKARLATLPFAPPTETPRY